MFSALKFAFRRLAKTPGFTFTALSTLAICLGANLTIFAVVDAIVVRSLPFPEAEKLVLLSNSYPKAGVERSGASITNYFDRRTALKSVTGLSLYQQSSITVGAVGAPHRVSIERVSPDFFKTLGVTLAKGAMFTDQELLYSTDSVAVITDGFWHSYFNADPNVVGRTFLNDGLATTVIGVLPKDFRFLSSDAEFYRPSSHDLPQRTPQARHNNNYEMIARLAPGATIASLQSEVDALNAQLFASDPYGEITKGVGYHTVVRALHAEHIRTVKPILVWLQWGVLLLLLIGCVNLVNLLLIRASGRAKEFAVRQALGARNGHIVGEVVAETALLAFGGCLYGMLLGVFGIDFLHTLGTDHLPLGANVRLDLRVGAAALVLTGFVVIALAAPVVTYVLRMKMATGLQVESRGSSSSRGAQRLRHIFIVAQVALAFVLLSGAGLLTMSLRRVLATSPGFTTSDLMAGMIALPWKNYQTPEARLAFLERLLPAVSAIPGVSSAAFTTNLPFGPLNSDSAVTLADRKPTPGEPLRAHYLAAVSSQYWKTMGIPLLQGRLLTDADTHNSAVVCVVDEAFAKIYWPKGTAIGHRISFGPAQTPESASTIVGVVGSVSQVELTDDKAHGAVYFPYGASGGAPFFALVLRSSLLPTETANAIRRTVSSLDPELPVDQLKVMQARIDDSLVARRSPTILAGIFAGAALLLAALGTYGVLSYAVAQRQTEIGVRIALGAQPAQIRRQFLLLGARLLGIGAVIGLVGSWAAGAAMQAVLFNSAGLHLETFLLTLVVMSTVAFSACFFPARRATRVDPALSIRAA